MSSLSSSCQPGVRAVEAPAASKAEPAPAAATTAKPAAETAAKPAAETAAPKAAESTAAKKPSDAQVAAIRSACRSDYQKVCAGVPTGGAPALQCLEKNKSKLSAGCAQAVAAAGGGAAAPTAAAASGTESEEHTSELQSHLNLVCRLLLEKKKQNKEHTVQS